MGWEGNRLDTAMEQVKVNFGDEFGAKVVVAVVVWNFTTTAWKQHVWQGGGGGS